MPGSDRPNVDHSADEHDALASVALVPLTPATRMQLPRRLTRPDPTFVAQLIATATQMPQTRNLRRATPMDAHSAYTAQRTAQPPTGCRTRQVI